MYLTVNDVMECSECIINYVIYSYEQLILKVNMFFKNKSFRNSYVICELSIKCNKMKFLKLYFA